MKHTHAVSTGTNMPPLPGYWLDIYLHEYISKFVTLY